MKQAVKEHFVDTFAFMALNGSMTMSAVNEWQEGNRITTGVYNPVFNGIFQNTSIKSNADEIIQQQVNYYQEKQMPFTWWLHDQMDHEPMLAKLSEKGFQPIGAMHGVSVEMNKVIPQPKAPANITVKRISTIQEIIDWVNIIGPVFQFKTNEGQFYTNFLLNTANDPKSSIFYYLGYLDGKPVGASSLYMTVDTKGRKVAGLWAGGVLPEGRKQGLGMAMAQKRIEDAKKMDADYVSCYLMADGMARGYCEKLGLKNIWTLYPCFSPVHKQAVTVD